MASKIEVPPAIHLRPEDNVAIATRTLETGVSIEVGGGRIAPSKRIGLGHKMALKNIKKGETVIKYGQIIGFATTEINPGDHVHAPGPVRARTRAVLHG